VHASREVARAVDQEIKAEFRPVLERRFPDWQPFLGAFISKGARSDNPLDLHQDWTYTEEPEVRARLLWCPLVDVDASSGALLVAPGSHTWSQQLRGSGSVPAPLEARAAALDPDRDLVAVKVRAGQAVEYDPALLHGSAPGSDRGVRPVAAIAFAPPGATLVHYHQEGEGPVERFIIDESYYTLQPFGSRPDGAPQPAASDISDR
jgi:ectoine hydroxylase-related dioxygenase (phytanoyl-CoA dioxygenase family)